MFKKKLQKMNITTHLKYRFYNIDFLIFTILFPHTQLCVVFAVKMPSVYVFAFNEDKKKDELLR